MNKDDPFGLESDAARTRIRPIASRRPAERPLPAETAAPGAAPEARIRQVRATDNPLIAAFAAPLGLAPELERAAAPENPEVLRARLLDNLVFSRDAAVSQGVSLARADQAAWYVAALLDDIALNTPWGGASDWPRQPLVVSLSGDVDAGSRFFDRLDELMRHPARDPEMLELAFMCLALGFRGKHRVSGAVGEGALTQLRAQIARLLTRRDDADAALAPHWQGVTAPDERPRFTVPLWSVAVLALGLVAAIYVGLGVRLSERAEQLYTLAELLPPPERAGIFRPVRDTELQAPELPQPAVIELLPVFRQAAPESTRGALTGREDVSITTLAVQADSPDVFRSAKADVNDVYVPLIRSIGEVIRDNQDLIGGVTVIGHTDSVPVQRSNPFSSNQGLSEARAETIARLLAEAGAPPGLISAEGRAATEPVADNATREGRARNRRVEIRIEKKV